jgi:hypothetical protein
MLPINTMQENGNSYENDGFFYDINLLCFQEKRLRYLAISYRS